MITIAHGIKNVKEAQAALKSGADFLEVDVAKRIIFTKFTTQHHGTKGKFGIGEDLEPILEKIPKEKLLLDIKHASSSLTFTRKFSALLIKHHIKKARICGLDWRVISGVCQKTGCSTFYTIRESKDIEKLEKILPKLAKPAGFCIRHELIDKDLISYCSNVMRTYPKNNNNSSGNFSLSTRLAGLRSKNNSPRFEIFAWTVNNPSEIKRLKKLGVDGIITDEWELGSQF